MLSFGQKFTYTYLVWSVVFGATVGTADAPEQHPQSHITGIDRLNQVLSLLLLVCALL